MSGGGGGMSKFQRVQQWLVFAKQWHIVDGNWQDPELLGRKVAKYLTGAYKPIFHPETDCGDHVIVFNCKHVAMKGFDWKRRDYYFDKVYPRGKTTIRSWKIHEVDPCRIVFMEVSRSLPTTVWRKMFLERLHLFPEEKVPEELLANVGNQLRQIQTVPKRLDQYSKEERERFPSLFDWPEDIAIDDFDQPTK